MRGEMIRALVIYDLGNDRKRRNYVKALNRFGVRVQYSAFEVMLPLNKYDKMLAILGKIMDENDSIRVYRMGEKRGRKISILENTFEWVMEQEDVFI